jgi:hypothetical protein
MKDMEPASDDDPLDDLETQLASERAASMFGWGVDGTVGRARLMLHQLENGWVGVELYWRHGPEYHEVSVDADPKALILELEKIKDVPWTHDD